MEDSANWQNSSQSFGYMQLSPKGPPMPATHISPSKSESSGLRWHNSVAEDFNSIGENANVVKRNASVAGILENHVNYSEQPGAENPPAGVPTHSNSQIKKRKPSSSTSIASSPLRPSLPSDGAFDHALAAGNHSTTQVIPAAKKRRGRPPKNPPAQTYISTIEFIQESGVGQGSEPQASASVARTKPRQSPVLHPLDTFVTFPESNLHSVNMESLNDIDFQSNKYWDASFAGSFLSDSQIGPNLTDMTGDIDLVSATATFDWSIVPTATTHGVMDPLRSLSMHSLGESFYPHPPHLDSLGFSFSQDPMSASDIISPVSVNPNLIFTSQDTRESLGDSLRDFRPYHQQNLQQEQELLATQRKRHSKAALAKAKPQLQPQIAAKISDGKPVMKRALTESALIKSAGKGRVSNFAVHPSPMKQKGSLSGKLRSAIRDENTTPSPTVDSVSVQRLSPGNSGGKKAARKVKTAVNFSISPGGRAKAEKVFIRDTGSLSERSDSEADGQGEYDTDSSTDEDDLGSLSCYSMAAKRLDSKRQSSGVSSSLGRPKLARFRTTPSDSASSSRFLISGDFTSDDFSFENPFLPPDPSISSFSKSPRRKSSHSKAARRHSRALSVYNTQSSIGDLKLTNLGSMREEDEYSEAETVVDEPTHTTQGDAVLALKQAVARRNSYSTPGGISRRPPSSHGTSRPSTRHTNILPSSPPMHQQQHPYGFSTPQTVRSGYSSDTFNISPTTVTDPDCVTPTTYMSKPHGSRADFAVDIRCSCISAGSPEMPVLQCNACFKWVHVQCEGYDRKPIPTSVICSFCKGGWQGPQQPQRVFRKPSLPQTISPATAQSFQG